MRVTIPPFYRIADLELDADIDFSNLYQVLKLALPALGEALRKGKGDIVNADIAANPLIAASKIVGLAEFLSLLSTEGDLLIRGSEAYERLAKITTGQFLKATTTGYEGASPPGAVLTIAETEVFSGATPNGWTDLDLSEIVGVNYAVVLLKVYNPDSAAVWFVFRRNGDTDEQYGINNFTASAGKLEEYLWGVFIVITDASGIIEWKTSGAYSTCTVDVIAFIK